MIQIITGDETELLLWLRHRNKVRIKPAEDGIVALPKKSNIKTVHSFIRSKSSDLFD